MYKALKNFIAFINQIWKKCFFKADIFVYCFAFQLFIRFFDAVSFVSSLHQTTTQEPFSACFVTMSLSSANPINASHSSLNMLHCINIESFRRPLKIYFSSWLKRSSIPGWPGVGFQLDIGQSSGLSENYSEGWSLKFHLMRILLEKSSKSFLNCGSFIDFWIGAKSNFFSKVWILISESTF